MKRLLLMLYMFLFSNLGAPISEKILKNARFEIKKSADQPMMVYERTANYSP